MGWRQRAYVLHNREFPVSSQWVVMFKGVATLFFAKKDLAERAAQALNDKNNQNSSS